MDVRDLSTIFEFLLSGFGPSLVLVLYLLVLGADFNSLWNGPIFSLNGGLSR